MTSTQRMKLNSVFTLLCFCFFSSLFAQDIQVLNIINDLPVEGVFIYNTDKTVTATTNKQGQADLSEFGPADRLCFQHQSFDLSCYSMAELKTDGYQISLLTKVVFMKGFDIVTDREVQEPEKHAQHLLEIPAIQALKTQPATTADMLQSTGQINVQKSQMGGGSPVIRGFEANKVLLVLDGVRMNNAIYRSGHLQNAITVDPNALLNTEVSFGPASVVYGSDALGGVVHFHTKDPLLAIQDSNVVTANAMARYASATNERTGHVDFNIGLKRIGFFTSVTATEFGDLKMGEVRTHGYDSLGLIFDYASREGDDDLMISNPDPSVQVGSGYQQLDLLQKVLYQANDNTELILNLQMSTSTEVPRYDVLNDYDGDELKWAEWYYGPQNRFMGAFEVRFSENKKIYDKGNIVMAVQRLNEDRVKRRFGREDRFYNEEEVFVYSLNLDLVKRIDSSASFSYGLEATHNDVTSIAYSTNILNDERTAAATRYPDGGSTLSTAAAYLNYKKELNPKLRIDLGTRYSFTTMQSSFLDTTFVTLPFDAINIDNGALTGSAGLVWRPDSSWQISTVVSSGFRNPNVDDYGKVFEKNGLVTVPNADLLPEFAYNGEIGIAKTFLLDAGSYDEARSYIKVHGIAWYTLLQNAIVRRDYQLNGADSLSFEGDLARIVTNTNATEANIYGVSFHMKAKLNENWSTSGSINYTIGRDQTDDVPLGHIPPLFGRLGVNWTQGRFDANVYSLFNGWKDIEDFAPDGVDNEEETTLDGTPAWYTLNMHLSYELHPKIKAQIGCNNLLDHHYKTFASGISAPGRNFIVALRAGF